MTPPSSEYSEIVRLLFMLIPISLLLWCGFNNEIHNIVWIWKQRKRMRELGYRFNLFRMTYKRLIWKNGDEEISITIETSCSLLFLKSYDVYLVDSRGEKVKPSVILMSFKDCSFEESIILLETREIEETTGIKLFDRLPFMSLGLVDAIVEHKEIRNGTE